MRGLVLVNLLSGLLWLALGGRFGICLSFLAFCGVGIIYILGSFVRFVVLGIWALR